mgnify:CR=1 FL=1|tara:strand:+ start:368 stop:562 length:195 start_codon:yes stop_codon:yes gene_type:complete
MSKCAECNDVFPVDDLNEDMICEECIEPVCSNCGEIVNEDAGRYCSKQCYQEEMYDLCEDDYKR